MTTLMELPSSSRSFAALRWISRSLGTSVTIIMLKYLHNRPRNVFDVYLILCQIITYLCDNAGVLTYDSDNCLLHVSILLFWFYVKSPEKPVMAALRKTWYVAKNVYLNLN